MRIYELAKELGVDNRVVITRAAELGMSGKTSHSNSLEPDEADQIRRAIIRQAIGTSPEKEVVTTRVDRVTGENATIVEKRKGNVIRRRRAGPDEAAAEAPPEVAAEASTNGHTPDAIEQANDLFRDAPAADRSAAEAASETAEAEPSEIAAKGTEVSQAKSAEPAVEEEVKKGAGPKVLGKIALPQKKVVRAEPRRTAGGAAVDFSSQRAPAPAEEESEEGRRAKKAKGRKREISRFDLVDYEGREARRGPRRGHSKTDAAEKKIQQTELTTPKASKRVVKVDEQILVGELAKQMSVKAGEVISKLMQLGVMATINHALDKETTQIVADEFGFQIESTSFDEKGAIDDVEQEETGDLKPRPPVVTVMGHVDHGKTSLLDAIRKASVAAREHGGITQHIGAYKVELEGGRSITFIDTPGHAAFTSMRARGAQVTDIVILVVAADDGVMPQTIEAINHAKAAGVTIAVAVNKIDKPGINPDRIKQQLAEHGIQPEDWGGDTMFFPVSALKGTGLPELLEGLLLLAEVKELRANPDRRAKGAIIETRQDRGRGTVAAVLVQAGTLRIGDLFVTGSEFGRVRQMLDYDGKPVTEAGPSTPVEITGLNGMPVAGDDFLVVESEATAREVALNRSMKKQAQERALASGPISLEEFSRRANNQAAQELNVILKADVHGSVEAAQDSIEKLSTDKVKVRVLHAAVGGVNESDIQLAIASNAVVIGFGVRSEPRAMEDAESKGVQVRFYRVIYELIDDVRNAMSGLLAPIRQEVPLGRAEVRETFTVPKLGMIAGSYVESGVVKRGAHLRLVRDSRVIHEGKMASLRRFKDDVKEVQSSYECGIGIEGFNDIKVGDVIEVFEFKEVAATL